MVNGKSLIIVATLSAVPALLTVSGNAHAFQLWIAALVNFVIYFLLFLAAGSLIGGLHRRISVSRHSNEP
jgi:hypothetical protein